jgi:hypothetical protein
MATRNPQMRRHRMTGTIDGIVAAIGGITTPPASTNSQKRERDQKRGSLAAPPFF